MNNLKRLLGILIFVICTILILPRGVLAEEIDTDEVIRKLAPDLKNAVFKMNKPTNDGEQEFGINGYVGNIIGTGDYYVYASCSDTCSVVSITITSKDYEVSYRWDDELGEEVEDVVTGWSRTYELNVTYDEPQVNSTVSGIIEDLPSFSQSDHSSYYALEDLSLINYYLTSVKSELWNREAPGRALKYSHLNEITKGSNVSFYLDMRAGIQSDDLMYELAFGMMSIFHDGYLYGLKEAGLYLRKVIYIPASTVDTKEAYVAAAQERINNYLGNDSVTVSYGGTLEELNALFSEKELQSCLDNGISEEECSWDDQDVEDEDYPVTSDGNYYNIKIGDRTYRFYIIKGEDSKLVAPTYLGTDIDSKIEVTSSDATVPLDTSLTVKEIEDDTLKDRIGT